MTDDGDLWEKLFQLVPLDRVITTEAIKAREMTDREVIEAIGYEVIMRRPVYKKHRPKKPSR